MLAPEWTDYNKRVQYQAFDVTGMIDSGDNAMGVLLGNGWYCGGWMQWRTELHPTYGHDPSLIAQLEIEYADGSRKTVITDESWRGTTDGPTRFSGIYEGEIYDARREMHGWDKAGYDDKGWKPVVIRQQKAKPEKLDFQVGKLVWQRSEPIRKTGEIKPVSITEPRPGVYVVNMGQLFSGWTRLRVQAPAGTELPCSMARFLIRTERFTWTTCARVISVRVTVRLTAISAREKVRRFLSHTLLIMVISLLKFMVCPASPHLKK